MTSYTLGMIINIPNHHTHWQNTHKHSNRIYIMHINCIIQEQYGDKDVSLNGKVIQIKANPNKRISIYWGVEARRPECIDILVG